MKTSEFMDLLKDHQGKSLVFEYAPGQRVGANYHITEVKNLQIDSVDCGTGTDSWNETIIQLWESPSERDKTEYLSAYKALGILRKVDKIRSMDPYAVLKFEYGNSVFHTAHLEVAATSAHNGQLLVHLTTGITDCKAKDACGLPEPAVAAASNTSCEPGSGCC